MNTRHPPPLIKLTGLNFHYTPDAAILRNFNLQLLPQQRLGLTGPNGSGKSTLLHLMLGLLKPDNGTIEIFGKVRKTESDFAPIRTRLGLLFQYPDDQLFCPTVIEDVAFGPLNKNIARIQAVEIARNTLRQLDLHNYENRFTHKLSGGEKHLVALAAVLAMNPDVLLLDEPAAGLDPFHLSRITDILRSLTQAMIIVSHDNDFLTRLDVHNTIRLRTPST